MKQKKRSTNRIFESYIIIFVIGIAVGILTRLTDFLSSDSLWTFSSIATLFGFWIFSITIIVSYSSSNKRAGINSFLYMFGMTISFYVLEYLLGLFLPRFDNGGFRTSLFAIYTALSLVCGIGGFLLYFWNRKNNFASILYALPVSALLAETVGVAIYFFTNQIYLFQLLFDLFCTIGFGILFFKKANNKILYGMTSVIVAAMVYLIIYRPFCKLS